MAKMSQEKKEGNGEDRIIPPQVQAKGATKKTEKDIAVAITIPPISLAKMMVPIHGIAPLVVNKWSEKAMTQIADAQEQKAAIPKKKKNPEEEYLASLHVLPGYRAGEEGARYGFPAAGIMLGMLDAAVPLGITKSSIRRCVRVIGPYDGGLIRLEFGSLRMRDDMVRLPHGGVTKRYRGEFSDWSMEIEFTYDHGLISPAQIINLLNRAGFESGLGEMRPSAPHKGMSNGMYEVVLKRYKA